MKKTKLGLISIVDGITNYITFYLWTAFMIWAGIKLLNLLEVNYFQCLGGLIFLRQLVAIIVNKTDKHIKNNSIIELEKERLEWSLKTFPEATPIASLRKLESEIDETEADIILGRRDPMEYADMLMCLFDSAGRQKTPIFPEEIFKCFEKKIAINKTRVWKKNPDNSYSHVK